VSIFVFLDINIQLFLTVSDASGELAALCGSRPRDQGKPFPVVFVVFFSVLPFSLFVFILFIVVFVIANPLLVIANPQGEAIQ
jgi:hypothetical protein